MLACMQNMDKNGACLSILWFDFDLLTQNRPCAALQCEGSVLGLLPDIKYDTKVRLNSYISKHKEVMYALEV